MKTHTIRFTLSLLCFLVALPLAGIAQELAATGSSPRVLPGKTMVVDWAAISTLDLETAVEIALAGNPG